MSEIGTVKWFKNTYGFIERENGEDVFVHYSEIESNGFKSLRKGDRVKFDVVDNPEKGPQAVRVTKIE